LRKHQPQNQALAKSRTASRKQPVGILLGYGQPKEGRLENGQAPWRTSSNPGWLLVCSLKRAGGEKEKTETL